jgi:hypothetical protein
VTIRDYHGADNTTNMCSALAASPRVWIGSGFFELAATIAGFAFSPLTAQVFPQVTTAITHLRDVLGDHPTNRSPARVRR